ncbi:hypothetical protein [Paracerasibacillus soli]|uniref:Lipoprotein n=1 Tax=Paracerasibacillus soli TaxID=480284 RepID=A0ABU5CSU4_9BACI|nr:hypothetical protein [Virgibacillus soli]MDY0409404.1 hypothetical protein [Virgibacillus soli]
MRKLTFVFMGFLIIFSAGCQALEKKPDTLQADEEKVNNLKKLTIEKKTMSEFKIIQVKDINLITAKK